MVNPFGARANRARALAETHATVRDLLVFYAGLADFQAGLFDRISGGAQSPMRSEKALAEPLAFRAALDRSPHHARVVDLPRWLSHHAPRPLAGAAEPLVEVIESTWDRMLSDYWAATDSGPAEARTAADDVRAFVVEAWLQPLATALAAEPSAQALAEREDRSAKALAERGTAERARCPACASRPVVALLAEAGHGARRSLLCGLCDTEWPAMRVTCPACGEAHAEALSVFHADEYPSARIDACRTCRTYMKTLDLTRDNTAVSPADDLASLPLDLWAREHGFKRLKPHLLRV